MPQSVKINEIAVLVILYNKSLVHYQSPEPQEAL